jgi:hypothetical protein
MKITIGLSINERRVVCHIAVGSGASAGPQSVVPVGLLLAITRPLNATSSSEPMGDEELLLLL